MNINITLRQAKELVDFFGGHDCEVTVVDHENGLLAYCTEYPEEGAQYIGDTDVDDDLAINGELPTFDLIAHLYHQSDWSERTFGPGTRAAGVVDHIRKELVEIEANPGDVTEWVDVVLLALDGAWRAGFSPEQIAQAIAAKQSTNESRQWPDWRTAEPGKAIEHIKGEGA